MIETEETQQFVTDINTSKRRRSTQTTKSIFNRKAMKRIFNNNQKIIRKTINNKKSKPKQSDETNDKNKTNRQFVCDFKGCGKQFKSKVYFGKHRKTHMNSGSDVFICDFIGCGYQTQKPKGVQRSPQYPQWA